MKQRIKKKTTAVIIMLISLSVLLFGCNFFGNNDTSDKVEDAFVTIKGNLSNITSKSFDGSVGSKALADADEIWAVPIGGGVKATTFSNKVIGEIQSDGTFSFDVPKETGDKSDWVLLLVNSSVTGTSPTDKMDKIEGYVALGDIDDNLIKLPTGDASGDVDVGTLEDSSDDSNEVSDSDQMDNQKAQFDLSLSQLKEMARTDYLLKLVRSAYANYDESSGEMKWYLNPWYTWGITDSTTFSALADGYFDPTDFFETDLTVDYHYSFDVLASSSIDDKVWSEGDDYIGFVFPGDVSYDDDTLAADTYQGIKQGDDGLGAFTMRDKDGEYIMDLGNFGLNLSSNETPPAGNWEIRETDANGTLRAVFKLNDVEPTADDYTSAGAHFRVYVPTAQINTDSSDNVTSVGIKWLIWDSSDSTYTQPEDTSVLADTLTNSNLHVLLGDGSYEYGAQMDMSNSSVKDSVGITKFQTVSDDSSLSEGDLTFSDLTEIGLSYKIMGNNFEFKIAR